MKYDQLPVFKEAYDLTLQVYKSSQTMKRELKYTLGEKLKEDVSALQLSIYRACMRTEKINHIITAREHIEAIRMKIRLLRDLGQMPVTNMAQLIAHTESVSKQLAAWQKKLTKENEEKTEEELISV